ncbi:MAG: diguanylate cyclase domain-containing protein [Terriglobales bacterium]
MKPEPKQAEVVQELQLKMKALSSRDLQLWSIGLLIIVVLAAGVAALVLPNLMWGGRQLILVSNRYLPQLLFGFMALIVIFNVYVLWQRRELENSRQELISEMMFNLRIQNLSFVDPLTEVFNRRYFDQTVGKETSMADRHGSTVAFVIVEIQNLKDINSQFGYLGGDTFLLQVAAILRNRAGACDTVVRYGGDEFLMILPDRDEEQATAMVQQLFADVEAWNRAPEHEYKLSINCGAATYQPGTEIKDVLRLAENRLRPADDGARSRRREANASCDLVSCDPAVREVIAPILESMGLSMVHYNRPEDAISSMARRRTDALIVDCDLEGGERLLTEARALPSSRGTVMIAITGGEAGRKSGANLLLEKPLNSALTARSLRVAYALIRAEQVRYFRCPVSDTVGVFAASAGQSQQCSIVGLSSTGMMVRSSNLPGGGPSAFQVGSAGIMRFRLAQKDIEVKADVAWCDGEGLAGLRFTDIGQRPSREIQRWLDEKAAEKDAARKLRSPAQVA